MSGPWDRPPRDPDPWPSEDVEPSAPAERQQPQEDAWSSGDLWPDQPREGSSSWGDWPAPAPPPDDYVVD
ncbi:MAG TPA: hypothetical protein VHP64_00915 [Candidatus Limnocylindria bacterium]|nr:hypothetical protein [Candidatus Limnocylindria bacterium]